MPKIDAPTVAEHRAQVSARLVDAAEEMLRTEPTRSLTASAVSAAVGIARNSIYRYVDSVDDLRGLVVGRHLPAWLEAVAESVAAESGPAERVVAWVGANLEQASSTGHGWLMLAAGAKRSGTGTGAGMGAEMEQVHSGMRDSLGDAWRELLGDDQPDRVRIAVSLTVGLLDAGFRELDAGRPGGLVCEMGVAAARALVGTYLD